MKRKIRLTEGELHRIIKESVKRILKEGEDYLFSNGNFDSYAYDYDKALKDANSVEEWDEMMRDRKKNADMRSYLAQRLHPQSNGRVGDKSMGATHYVYPELFRENPDKIDAILKRDVENNQNSFGIGG